MMALPPTREPTSEEFNIAAIGFHWTGRINAADVGFVKVEREPNSENPIGVETLKMPSQL